MSKTNALRKVIVAQLNSLKDVYPLKNIYYRKADDKALYPHVVYNFKRVSIADLNRDDVYLEIDVYDKNEKIIENMADDVENLFNATNLPQAEILPTFFRESRTNAPDEDVDVRHINLVFLVQNYER